jgi:hypothetical protein
MNDLEMFTSMLDGAGYAGYSAGSFPDGPPEGKKYEIELHENNITSIALGWGSGYRGFYCVLYFNAVGKLTDHGVWE